MQVQENVSEVVRSRVERKMADVRQGEALEIDKAELQINRTYQRQPAEARIKKMAAQWSSVSAQVLLVAMTDRQFFVIDGQHRLLAAMLVPGVRKLNCLVFEMTEEEQAAAYIVCNRMRKPLTSIDLHKAELIKRDAVAIEVQQMCDVAGRSITNKTSATTVRCVKKLKSYVSTDRDNFKRVWPLIVELAAGHPMTDEIIDGLVYLEENMPDGETLTSGHWRKRALHVGWAEMQDHIKKVAGRRNNGKAEFARGILNAINHGTSRRIEGVKL